MRDAGPADGGGPAAGLSPTDEPFAATGGDVSLLAPLAGLAGARPAAPDWFEAAIATAHDRAHVEVEGVPVEWLGWGEAGRPGVLLLHGNGANADWWRFIAPFLASAGMRVAALSWSGMGNSGHRARYATETFLAEALAAAEAAGLGARFAVAGHSFGGVPAAALAALHPERVARAIIIDTPFALLDERRPPRGPARPHRVHPDLETALARFRWAPVQPSPNLFITDFIARTSLRKVDGGWSWKFDPYLWEHFAFGDANQWLAGARAPLAYVWGEQSLLVQAGVVQRIRAIAPAGTRFVGIPEAHHHVMADQPLALVAALRALLP